MCVAKSIPVVATGVSRLYPSDIEPHISRSLGKPRCNSSRVDIKPDKKNKNKITVVQGYTNSGFWNITSVFPVLFYRHLSVILMRPLDVTSAAHSLFFTGKFKMPNITLQSKDKMLSISGTGDFINAPYNRFGLFLQWHGRLMF